jgi:hypothetical protein
LKPQAVRASTVSVSEKVSSFAPAKPDGGQSSKKTAEEKARAVPNNLPFRKQIKTATRDAESHLASVSAVPMPTPALSFDGLSSNDNAAAYGFRIVPPDPFGDVGPNHYVQAVNALVRVFDKNGAALTPPFKLSSLFSPLGTACSTRNDGDPIVLYDALADRWLISQFCNNFPPFRQIVAVSKTGDPTGEFYIYEFVMPNVKLNDYSKIGVWSDAFYMTTDQFSGGDYAGTGVFAFDKTKMLAGDDSAGYVYFDLSTPSTARLGGLLPADLDGVKAPPPAGAPNVFVGYAATEYGDARDAIRLFDFHADFQNPPNSTFAERAESPLAVAAFDPTSPDGRADIAQPAPGEKLDSQSDRLMYRAAYRNFGEHESLVFNQTVALDGNECDLSRRQSAFMNCENPATVSRLTSKRRSATRRVALDGKRGSGSSGQYRCRLQLRQRRKKTFDCLYGKISERAARNVSRRNRFDPRNRRAKSVRFSLGRLFGDEHRSARRLHVLADKRVLHGGKRGRKRFRLADAHREIQIRRMPRRAARDC